jgi:hypothetical protein
MSTNVSWEETSHPYTEKAISLVRDLVAALRKRGTKTEFALKDLPGLVDTTPTRIKTLFYGEKDRVVLKHEWMSLRYRAGLFWLNEAARYRILAEEAEERGNDLVSSQLELPIWETQNITSSRQRRCA